MLKNIRNEWYKVLKNKRVLIFSLISVFTSIGLAVVFKDIEMEKMVDQETIDQMTGGMYPLQLMSILSEIVFPIFATLMVAGVISDELSAGTMKLPLLCGQKRSHLIGAKITAVVMSLVLVLFITLISSVGVSIAFWGFKSVWPMLGKIILKYLLLCLPIIGWCIMCAFAALFINNGGILVGLAAVILVIFGMVNNLFPNVARFQITYYFAAFGSDEASYNMGTALMVCILTILVFLLFTLFRFKNMEINK